MSFVYNVFHQIGFLSIKSLVLPFFFLIVYFIFDFRKKMFYEIKVKSGLIQLDYTTLLKISRIKFNINLTELQLEMAARYGGRGIYTISLKDEEKKINLSNENGLTIQNIQDLFLTLKEIKNETLNDKEKHIIYVIQEYCIENNN